MSRFPELFEEAIEEVVTEAFLVEELAEHVARHIVARQSALRAEVRIEARYPRRRKTPVTGLSTQELVTLIGIAAATRAGARRLVGVEAIGINACPCAQGLVRGRATERQLNFETIHAHEVVAERYGTVGELRSELDGEIAERHTDLAAWLRC